MAYRSGGPKVLVIVLAGGEGKRLMPLTADRAKPAVPFGGIYRLIDFALSNVVNSGYLKIVVLTQYKSHSLDRHVSYLTTSRDNGTLVLAGAFPEVDGALLLLEAETPGAVLAWAANDPYNAAGLIRSMTVREVNVAIRR